LKPFYDSWTAELTAFVELAKPIYEEWTCNMSSQWHKNKSAYWEATQHKKKYFRFAFFFPYLLFFVFYFIFVILLYSFSFISTLRTMLYFKCGGIRRIFVFFVVLKKKNYVWSLELLLIFENTSIMYEN
jgi:hypothetical protein